MGKFSRKKVALWNLQSDSLPVWRINSGNVLFRVTLELVFHARMFAPDVCNVECRILLPQYFAHGAESAYRAIAVMVAIQVMPGWKWWLRGLQHMFTFVFGNCDLQPSIRNHANYFTNVSVLIDSIGTWNTNEVEVLSTPMAQSLPTAQSLLSRCKPKTLYLSLSFVNDSSYFFPPPTDLHVHNDDQNSVGGGGPSTLQAVRRSLSQTLLYQMSNTSPFGLGSRSNSPSMLLNSPLRNRTGFISNGPSLQSLVKSFINKVSRGTQTDCDDNFDVVSIASMTSGFSAFASDLTRSRLNMFLNDKSSVSNADDSEFVEELQKLRDQIDTRFGVDFTENEFNMMEIDATSVSRQESVKRSKVKQTTNQAVETENLETEESTTQTDDEEKPIGKSISIQIAPDMNESQTQTDKAKLCPHCCRVIASQSSFQFVENQLKPMIKCEILISVILLILYLIYNFSNYISLVARGFESSHKEAQFTPQWIWSPKCQVSYGGDCHKSNCGGSQRGGKDSRRSFTYSGSRLCWHYYKQWFGTETGGGKAFCDESCGARFIFAGQNSPTHHHHCLVNCKRLGEEQTWKTKQRPKDCWWWWCWKKFREAQML